VLLVNAARIILFLSETTGGRVHDKTIAASTPYPLPAGSRLLQDLGFVAFTLPEVEILMLFDALEEIPRPGADTATATRKSATA